MLDDITLRNLDILDQGGQLAGSLLEKLDHCSTAFGKSTIPWSLSCGVVTNFTVVVNVVLCCAGRRLLKQWLCAPLCDPRAIRDRLDAVTTLISHAHLIGETRELLKTLPDLQRLLRQSVTSDSVCVCVCVCVCIL